MKSVLSVKPMAPNCPFKIKLTTKIAENNIFCLGKSISVLTALRIFGSRKDAVASSTPKVLKQGW